MSNLIEYRISQALAASQTLRDAVVVESGLMELLSLAAAEENQAARWQRYEDLKKAALDYVGGGAQKEALRTTHAYEAFIEALDELLPEPLEEIA